MAGPKTEGSGRIVKQNGNGEQPGQPQETLLKLLMSDATQKEISRALPKHITPDRMIRIAITALKSTRYLAQCTPHTFFGCLIQASQLGLEVNTPLQHCFLIPRRAWSLERRMKEAGKNPGTIYECTLLMGYQGMIELSTRSDRLVEIGAEVVREGDYFKRRKGLVPLLEHEPSDAPDREQKPITHVWALARLKSGGTPWVSLSHAQIEARRARSSSPDDGPWVTDYEAMAQKTAIRALWKFLPKSSEMAQAESLEVATELGRSQQNVFDPAVREAIERQGLQPLTSDDEELPVPEPEVKS